MADYPTTDLSEFEFCSLEGGAVSFNVKDKIAYVAVKDSPSSIVWSLYNELETAKNHLFWLPNFLYPTAVNDPNNPESSPIWVLPIECDDHKRLCEYRAGVLVHRDLSYDKGRPIKWHDKLLYPKVELLRLIWSILLTIHHFISCGVRPKLNSNTMFVSNTGYVIFTEFEYRDLSSQDAAYEAKTLVKFLKEWMKSSRVISSEIIAVEINPLYAWLTTSNLGCIPGASITDALKQVLFWSPEMRIRYIMILHDEMEYGGAVVFPDAQNAFTKKDASGRILYTDIDAGIRRSANPVLRAAMEVAKDYYTNRTSTSSSRPPPSWLRSNVITTFTPAQKLQWGLTRLRDSLEHVYEHFKELTADCKVQMSKMTRNTVQMMFQDVFPAHMVELSKVTIQSDFDAVGLVQSILW